MASRTTGAEEDGMAQRIVPCIWLDGTAEAAAATYARVFPDAGTLAVARYPQSGENPPGRPPGSVLTIELALAGHRFTLLDGGPQFRPNPSISFFVHVDGPADADALFGRLADGGQVLMPIDRYPWSPRYGWVQDRFGVSWQVIAGRHPAGAQRIVPCLMFAGRRQGLAEEAMRAYAAAFPEGRIDALERYAAGEGPQGSIKHGRMRIAGEELVLMDSHVANDVEFDEGLSLQVRCEDQAEVDRSWTALSAGGAPGPCGWLKDRFGVSWQVVPSRIDRWMAGPDRAASDRVFRAVMGMGKLDVSALERAFTGR